MRNRLYNFMVGRYGLDDLEKFLFVLWIVLGILNLFIRSRILQIIVFLLCFWVLFRMLSRNFTARRRENEFYLKHSSLFRSFFSKATKELSEVKKWASLQRVRFAQRKTHRFFTCPACGSTLRVPRKKGLMEIRCVRCGHRFTKRIR